MTPTKAMIKAGVSVFVRYNSKFDSDEDTVERIYDAMVETEEATRGSAWGAMDPEKRAALTSDVSTEVMSRDMIDLLARIRADENYLLAAADLFPAARLVQVGMADAEGHKGRIILRPVVPSPMPARPK